MQYVAWFKDLDKTSIPLAGGKGANLGEMFQNNFPVPNGFAVTAQTYKEFIEKQGIKEKILSWLSDLNVEKTTELQDKAKQIQDLIRSTPIPEEIEDAIVESYELLGADEKSAASLLQGEECFVAVRSSATAEDLPDASFAGQQASFLNVRGGRALIEAVRNCWASLFTARAIYYRTKQGFAHDKVLISAIVQRMVNSERSGVMFTVNPSTNDGKELVVEAVYGLGETIVGGQVTPDLYLVDKEKKEISKVEVKKQTWGLFRDGHGQNFKKEIPVSDQKQRVLHDKFVLELARIGMKLEEHYGGPQDIEWAIEGEKVFIVQTRAVTTFKKKGEDSDESSAGSQGGADASVDLKEISEPVLLQGETASQGVAIGPVVLVKSMADLGKVKPGDVLVTAMTTPDMVPAMKKASAIVTDEGGLTSHAAIVSREMGIPCIVGTGEASAKLSSGQTVTVYASKGVVFDGEIAVLKSMIGQESNGGEKYAYVETKTHIKVICDLPDVAEKAALTKAEGVGLARLEIIIAEGGKHPAWYIREDKDDDYVELLKKGIRKIAEAFKEKPVWVRCSDIRTDEYRNLVGGKDEPDEDNPMMGWHAIRRLLDEPRILKAEFKAVKELHEEGLTNVGVMLPFVIRVEELRAAKKIMREVGLKPVEEIDFGVMVETPAACWIIEELCKEEISFVSFGTNDLTQLTLGIDRNNERIASLFDEMHPAVLGEIAKVIAVCKEHGVETSICGQAGSKPEMVKFLVKCGIDSISANRDAVAKIRHIVAKIEKK